MNFFSDSLDRIKYLLRVSKDGEVAAALGLSKTAFAERKRRLSFPEKELYALAAKRPELNLDVDYVLTGIPREARAHLAAQREGIERASDAGLSSDEVRVYARVNRLGPSPERTALLTTLLGELRVTEFEGVFALVKSIVDLRAALGAAGEDKAGKGKSA